ncbi:hypothetical protein HCN44_005838 [Aphidius gifuensis]|uniref:Hexosyltransferase n=1 Tax=Aphidius gifuensis TaxID=684658 RepID=A0A834XV35_APHGI|nr:beta-1,3-galactosyltransferase 1-like [Aphidius gifuensis]KAF7993057.1 hypothetical protein HCN44_005838 [Aphidius gifuensis]
MLNRLTFTGRTILSCLLLLLCLLSFLSILYRPDWTLTSPKNLSLYIKPNENTTIISPNENHHCKSSPYLYIIICSSVNNQDQRNAIRNTWGSSQHLEALNYSVKINFILGHSEINHDNDLVSIEADKYGDIIQENFHDSYNNLTIKVGMILKWVNKNCKGIKYLMKTDDDMFVNIDNLLTALSSKPHDTNILIGHLVENQIPIRDSSNIWYTPRSMYHHDKFPDFVSGTGYVMSIDVAIKIYNASLKIPFIFLEDVYFTGICADNVGVKPAHQLGFSFEPRRGDINISNNSITSHQVTVNMMHAIWNMSHHGYTNYKKTD